MEEDLKWLVLNAEARIPRFTAFRMKRKWLFIIVMRVILFLKKRKREKKKGMYKVNFTFKAWLWSERHTNDQIIETGKDYDFWSNYNHWMGSRILYVYRVITVSFDKFVTEIPDVHLFDIVSETRNQDYQRELNLLREAMINVWKVLEKFPRLLEDEKQISDIRNIALHLGSKIKELSKKKAKEVKK